MPKKRRRRRRRGIDTETNEGEQGSLQQSQETGPPSSLVTAKNCAVCLIIYDGNERRPRMLPCGHTFCTHCISKTFGGLGLSCPNCRRVHHASSTSNFPVNFDLESILQEYMSGTSFMENKPMIKLTKKLQDLSERLSSLRIEFVSGVKSLTANSKDLSSQLEHYNAELETWKGEHQDFAAQINLMVKRINEESKIVEDAIEEELIERRRMEMASRPLQSASTESLIFQSVKNVNLCSQELERWVQKTKEDFPNTVLITQSKELRGRYKPGPLKQCNAQDIERIQNSSSASAKLHHSSISLQEMDESSAMTSQLRDESGSGCLYPTIQERIHTATEGILPWQRDQAVQTELRETAFDVLQQPTSAIKAISPFDQRLLNVTSVLVVNEKEGEQEKWFANINVDSHQRVLMSALQCHEGLVPESDCVLLKHDKVMAMVGIKARRVFLELGVGGLSLGRLIILVNDDGKYTSNFFHLCFGDKGHSYVGSKMLKAKKLAFVGEYVITGDYDRNDGQGGQAVLSGVDWEKDWERMINNREKILYSGMVVANNISEAQVSQFTIKRGGIPTGTFPMLGRVEEGLDILKQAISKYSNITQVEVIDCGVILQQ